MSFFTVAQLSAGYGQHKVLENIGFSVDAGRMVGILGANGSGKTTLLKAICGILPHTGSCTLDGTALESLPPKKLGMLCGYIPQRSGITIDISVLDVVLMGFNPRLGLLEHPDHAMKQRALGILAQVGLAGLENRNYLSLSEGQKQLCILARTLVSDGKLLLLDEPESALDFAHRSRMLNLLRQRIAGKKQSVLVTLHDPMLALNRCDVLLLLNRGRSDEMIDPAADSLEKMEEALSRLYGPVSLTRVRNRSGQEQLIMLGEEI